MSGTSLCKCCRGQYDIIFNSNHLTRFWLFPMGTPTSPPSESPSRRAKIIFLWFRYMHKRKSSTWKNFLIFFKELSVYQPDAPHKRVWLKIFHMSIEGNNWGNFVPNSATPINVLFFFERSLLSKSFISKFPTPGIIIPSHFFKAIKRGWLLNYYHHGSSNLKFAVK